LVWGVLISIPFLIISNALTIEEKQRALRVDVLHIIALGLLTIMFVYFISKHKKWTASSSYSHPSIPNSSPTSRITQVGSRVARSS
jgi:hypothetical protein